MKKTPAMAVRLRHTVAGVFLACAMASAAPAEEPPLETLTLEPGFSIELFARVPGARSIVVVPELDVAFVGSRNSFVHAVSLKDRSVTRVLDGLTLANGIDWKAGFLYVAEQHRVTRYRAGSIDELKAATAEVLYADLPDNPWHGWRYARFGPDGMLYVSIGVACNICWPAGLQGTIVRLDPDNPAEPEVFASGVRNSVGLGFHPQTGHLFFTDNGADTMGDDSPPDELNTAPQAGLDFGYPIFGGGQDRTRQYMGAAPPPGHRLPVVSFQAHVAPLGFDFYTAGAFPESMHGDAFLAQHGSWNRSVPVGYRVMRVRFDDAGNATGAEPFVEGWLRPDGSKWGRPVDVRTLADGSVLVSDDGYGALWRITYTKP